MTRTSRDKVEGEDSILPGSPWGLLTTQLTQDVLSGEGGGEDGIALSFFQGSLDVSGDRPSYEISREIQCFLKTRLDYFVNREWKS